MKKICYCNHCGTKNSINDLHCKKCEKEMKDKSILLVDYILKRGKEEVKGELEGNFLDVIKSFIKNHLYGVIFSVTVITAVAANVIVRLPDQEHLVKEPTAIVTTSFNSPEKLLNALERNLKEGNVNEIYSMLYQYNYKDEAKKLKIDALTSELFNHVKGHALKEAEIDTYMYDNWEPISSFCKEREGLDCVNRIDVSNSNHKFYETNILATFYSTDIENEYISKGEKTFVGKDDFDILLVEVDGNYYIADLFDNHFDPNIISVGGDISKLDYETQMEIYVGKPSEEGN